MKWKKLKGKTINCSQKEQKEVESFLGQVECRKPLIVELGIVCEV